MHKWCTKNYGFQRRAVVSAIQGHWFLALDKFLYKGTVIIVVFAGGNGCGYAHSVFQSEDFL